MKFFKALNKCITLAWNIYKQYDLLEIIGSNNCKKVCIVGRYGSYAADYLRKSYDYGRSYDTSKVWDMKYVIIVFSALAFC